MFGDPWIMGGAGAMIAIITIAAGIRLYNRMKNRVETKSKPSA